MLLGLLSRQVEARAASIFSSHPQPFLPLKQHLTGLGASLPGEKGALWLSRVAAIDLEL
jgi:hypothetical protein